MIDARRIFAVALFLTPVLAAGCRPQVPGPVELDTTGVEPKIDYTRLAEALAKTVNDKGQVVAEIARSRRDALTEQLKLLAVTGPTATPELLPAPADRLAYWYNARAAWAMELGLRSDFSEHSAGPCILQRRFPLDGRMMTLCQIDSALCADGDFRTIVAAPGVHVDRARMPTEVFSSEDIHERIARRFEEFIDDPLRFEIRVDRKRIRVPAVLWDLRERLVARFQRDHNAAGANLVTVLLWHVNGSAHRRLQSAIGYRIVGPKGRLPPRRPAGVRPVPSPTRIYDITVTMGTCSSTVPGDPLFARTAAATIEADGYAVSALRMSAHEGTHLDAPAHFLPDGKAITDYPPERFVLNATVVDAAGRDEVDADVLAGLEIARGEAVLFQTDNSASHPGRHVHLSVKAADALVDRGVSLVGLDALSVDAADSTRFPIHRRLLAADVLILEGLDLAAVPPGRYTLCCLPLKLPGTEASPTRAVLLAP